MMTVAMYCAGNSKEATDTYREPVNRHQRYLADAASDWAAGTTSKDYPNHPKMLEARRKVDHDAMRPLNMVWTVSPTEIINMITTLHNDVGGFDIASLMSNAWTLPADKAAASMRLISDQIMPHFKVR